MSHPLDGAFARVKRANQHLTELSSHAEGFGKRNLGLLVLERNKVSGLATLHLQQILTVPIEICLLSSECIHNLRAALDYTVYELAKFDSNGVPQKNTQFVIVSTPSAFQYARGRLNGLSAKHKSAIEKLQPYNGADWTETLQSISNPDKHRHLINPAVKWDGLATLTCGVPGSFAGRDGQVFHGMGDDGCDVLVERVHTTEILFADEKTPVVKTLQMLVEKVAGTVNGFRPEFD